LILREVDGVNLGIWPGIRVGKGAMTDRASHVEDSLGAEVRVVALDPCDDTVTHVGIISAHLTHRVDVNRAVIHRTLGHVAINVFSMVAAGLTMNIYSTVVLGQWEIVVES
jgi:hypothetical protein